MPVNITGEGGERGRKRMIIINRPIIGNNFTPMRYDAFTGVKVHNLHYRHSKFYAYFICYTGSTLYITE
jgi:hypothetical protein